MEDKEFNNIMYKYVESTKGSMEKDFSKLKKTETKNCLKRKSNKRVIWTFATVLIAIVVILSVVLPVTLINSGNDNDLPVIYQINKDDVAKETVLGISDVPNYNNFMLPHIEYLEEIVLMWQLKSDDSNIGFEMQVNVWDEHIESIGLIVLKNEDINIILNLKIMSHCL